MDFQRLKTFRTVATLMNFNQAAKVLNYAQSSISSQIKTLENEIGAPLFKRIGKRVVLTEAGEKMLRYTHKLLSIEAEARAEITGKSEIKTLLTLRMPQTIATYHLPEALCKFHAKYPDVHFDVTSCALYSLEHELSIGTVDLAFLLADSIDVANLNFEMLKVEQLILVTSPRHPLTCNKPFHHKALRDHPLLLPKSDCGYRMMFEQMLTLENIRPAAIIEMNSIEAIKQSVIKGMGLTIIPEIAVREELKQKRLVQLSLAEEIETGICMIWHKDKWFSEILKDFMTIFRQHLAD
ncbi:MAG: LysR family transcriptional regulator [Proteobacteria bacterium]|nr:LysR family transcriptional regulator [Pseudomonadota bacterium]